MSASVVDSGISLHAVTALRMHRRANAIGEPPALSSDAYAVASIELYSRLWLALERVADRLAAYEDTDSPQIETAVIILRLELLVLLDACDSPLWRSMLRAEQRIELEVTLKSVLRILSERVDDSCGVISHAQDRLLDAVLTQCSYAPHLVRSSFGRLRAGSG